VLILCYDFPPLNTAGALRPFSWYQELNKHNIYPIVITRKWSARITKNDQKFSNIETKTEVIKTDHGTLIKSAYKPDLKSRLISKYGFKNYSLLRKFLSLRGLLLGPFFKYFDEYNFIYKEAHDFLSREEVDLIIATGSPFGMFKPAHILSKEFNTKWMADYRDPFTSNWSIRKSITQDLFEFFKIYLEKKWTKNVVHFTSVSAPIVDSIKHAISKNGTVIRNGYDSNLIPKIDLDKEKAFIITYIGTVYDSEYLNILEKGIERFLDSRDIVKQQIIFQFVGIELNHTPGTNKILKLKERFPDNMAIIPSCSNQEALLISARSSILLNLSFNFAQNGIVPVKLYEYLALNKPIIHIELKNRGEKSEFDNYLNNISNAEEFSDCLLKLYHKWELNEPMRNKIPEELVVQFSRSNQTKLLAALINRLV